MIMNGAMLALIWMMGSAVTLIVLTAVTPSQLMQLGTIAGLGVAVFVR